MKQCKIYTESIEEQALEQFYSALEQPYAVKGALMADAHPGYSLPIGGVVATDGVIVPAWVGYDIGCGMCAFKTTFTKDELLPVRDEVFKQIYLKVPTGLGVGHKHRQPWRCGDIGRTKLIDSLLVGKGLRQLGTLGAGNHFIELGKDEEAIIWIIVHSGSRGLGHATATHYMRVASGDGKAREGHYGLDVNSEYGKQYIKDLNFCLAYALESRERMLCAVYDVLFELIGGDHSSAISEYGNFGRNRIINRNHNHAELSDGLWIHRKGATHAEEGMMGVIPGNMRDGSFIVEGKGNPESLCSSSHGAGRVGSRKQAKKDITMDMFTEAMSGITAKVDESNKDEAPQAYKDIFKVMDAQRDLVEVKHYIVPIVNVKG